MTTRSGKVYSERPSSAAANNQSDIELSQEPVAEDTSNDRGDDIDHTTNLVSDRDSTDLFKQECATHDALDITNARSPPLGVDARAAVDDLVTDDDLRPTQSPSLGGWCGLYTFSPPQCGRS
jgi:hypothetical protein